MTLPEGILEIFEDEIIFSKKSESLIIAFTMKSFKKIIDFESLQILRKTSTMEFIHVKLPPPITGLPTDSFRNMLQKLAALKTAF